MANLVSNTGTWMQLTVQNLLVLDISGSAAATGLSLSVQAAPGLLLGLVGGAVVDAWPRKFTAAVSQAVLGLVAFTTATLVALDVLNMPLILMLSAITGMVATVDNPACSLLGNDLVPRKDVPSAIALGSLVHSSGRLIGAALAGVVVGIFGMAVAYGINGLSFLFVVSVIPFLRLARRDGPEERPAEQREPARKRASLGGAGEGIAYFFRRPRLVALTVITGISAIFGRNYSLTLAVLVTGPLTGDPTAFGSVSTVLAVGGIVGAVLAGRFQKPSVRLIGTLAATGALLQVASGLSPSLFALILLVAPMAVVESISDTAGTTVLQTDPPPEMRGRVLGVWRSFSTGWGLIGPALIGALMEFVGPRGTLIGGGLLIIVAIVAGRIVYTLRTDGLSMPALRPKLKETAA